MLEGKSGGNYEGQEFVLCIGRGLVRANGMESFCMMLAESVERSGEMAMQGREKTGVKAYEARRSSSPSSRTATGAGSGGRVIIEDKRSGNLAIRCYYMVK